MKNIFLNKIRDIVKFLQYRYIWARTLARYIGRKLCKEGYHSPRRAVQYEEMMADCYEYYVCRYCHKSLPELAITMESVEDGVGLTSIKHPFITEDHEFRTYHEECRDPDAEEQGEERRKFSKLTAITRYHRGVDPEDER